MKCFVIMPFGDPVKEPERARHLDLIYTQWIKPAVESVQVPEGHGPMVCHRADKELRPGDIISHVVENLVTADIVVADLSGKNPNVFYELGVRHATNNNTILIADNPHDIPFDLRGLRTIVYKYDPEQMLHLAGQLKEAIAAILRSPEQVDNPARAFLYNREVERMVRQHAPPGYDVVKELLREVAGLRSTLAEQMVEMREVMRLITAPAVAAPAALAGLPSASGGPNVPAAPVPADLTPFAGAWEAQPEGSNVYMRVLNGRLAVVYCYAGDQTLTAHMYNVKVIGTTFAARFAWFERKHLKGYVLLTVTSPDKLAGGWWDGGAVRLPPQHFHTQLKASLPGMHPWELFRKPRQQFPAWAEQYFLLPAAGTGDDSG